MFVEGFISYRKNKYIGFDLLPRFSIEYFKEAKSMSIFISWLIFGILIRNYD